MSKKVMTQLVWENLVVKEARGLEKHRCQSLFEKLLKVLEEGGYQYQALFVSQYLECDGSQAFTSSNACMGQARVDGYCFNTYLVN